MLGRADYLKEGEDHGDEKSNHSSDESDDLDVKTKIFREIRCTDYPSFSDSCIRMYVCTVKVYGLVFSTQTSSNCMYTMYVCTLLKTVNFEWLQLA